MILRTKSSRVVDHLVDGTPVEQETNAPTVCHDDIISNSFWDQHPELLA